MVTKLAVQVRFMQLPFLVIYIQEQWQSPVLVWAYHGIDTVPGRVCIFREQGGRDVGRSRYMNASRLFGADLTDLRLEVAEVVRTQPPLLPLWPCLNNAANAAHG